MQTVSLRRARLLAVGAYTKVESPNAYRKIKVLRYIWLSSNQRASAYIIQPCVQRIYGVRTV